MIFQWHVRLTPPSLVGERSAIANGNHSSRSVLGVLVEVTSQINDDIKFTQDNYKFFAVTYSPIGSIVGKVTILNAHQNTDPEGLGRCGYSIRSGDMVPFTVDSQGRLHC
ncbi:unnamed protein product [Dibothriocephalus latus]|uniref:Cadherin domain-containing protein n=1 Tax=Dibothriocephalus latus TaxID=60516 RepID=A0A3P7LJV2_DIBLA|nr:unnamed protein product [Dibothriocephalus latus]